MKKNNKSKREWLVERGYEDAIVLDNPSFDDAIIGVDAFGHAVYDFEKMAQCLMDDDGLTYEEAVEFIEYNTIRALPYIPEHPVVVYPYDEE